LPPDVEKQSANEDTDTGDETYSWLTTPFGSNEENNLLYSQVGTAKAYKANFYYVKTGSNGAAAVALWDYCTGVGGPRGLSGKLRLQEVSFLTAFGSGLRRGHARAGPFLFFGWVYVRGQISVLL
jgi:hypothetical protein